LSFLPDLQIRSLQYPQEPHDPQSDTFLTRGPSVMGPAADHLALWDKIRSSAGITPVLKPKKPRQKHLA
jgi:hypothetical protein